jgi:hypothetical protein
MGAGSFPGGKERPGREADLSPPSSAVAMKEKSYASTPPMGRTACTETQCLYKGDLYFTNLMMVNRSDVLAASHEYTYRSEDLLTTTECNNVNPLNPELNPIYYLLALLGAHHFLHVSRIRVK